MKEETTYRHILKYAGLFGGVQGLSILIGLVRNKVIAFLLGPVGVGLISIYNTAIPLLESATNFGLQMSGVREISQAYDAGDTREMLRRISLLRSLSLMAALLGAVVCLLSSGLLSQWAFSSYDHALHFASLSVVVAMLAVTGGETAILKATRRLRQLARISVMGVISALVISVPIFVKWRYDGIIPSIILIAFVQMLLTVSCSWRCYPPSLSLGVAQLREGRAMLTVGIAFVFAGVLNSGTEFAVRAYLSDMSVSLAGLYNAGYMITMTYAGMVFAAMETDYYPHLSAVCHDTEKMSHTVNRQMEVSVMLIAPMLVALMFALRFLIPLLFSGKFLPVIGMTQIAVLAMYFRAVDLPVSYIFLAKGDSKAYVFMEGIYDFLLIATVIMGYVNWQLEGTGIALAVTSFIHAICVTAFSICRYSLDISNRVLKYLALQVVIALISLMIVRNVAGPAYWLLSIVMPLLSATLSVRMYKGAPES